MAQLRTMAFRTIFLHTRNSTSLVKASHSHASHGHSCIRYGGGGNRSGTSSLIPRSIRHFISPCSKSHPLLLRYNLKCQNLYQNVRLNVKVCRRDFWRTFSDVRVLVPRLIVGRSKVLFALVAFHPLEFIKKKFTPEDPHLNEEILSHIPKEVFRLEGVPSKKKKLSLIRRFLRNIWRNIRYIWRFVQVLCVFLPVLLLYPMSYISDGMQYRWWRILLAALEFSGPTFIKLGQWGSTRRDLFPDAFCDLFAKLHSSTRVHSWYLTQSKLRNAFGKNWRQIFAKVEKRPVGSGCIAQVHKAWMRVDMIPDESIVEEVIHEMDDNDDTNHEVDFAEGLEILGFGAVMDAKDDMQEYIETKIPQTIKPVSSPPAEKSTVSTSQEVHTEGGEAPSADVAETPAKKRPPLLETRRMAGTTITEINGDQVIPVAIKVLHPNIHKGVVRDLSIMRSVATFVERLFPSLKWLSVRDCIDEFSDLMTKQIDLRHETRCLEKFIDHFEDVPYIRFPKPIRPYCKRDVIVETYEEGEPIMKFIQGDSEQYQGLRELLASYGAEAIIQMIFVDNLVHGDLHPGNIIVQNADSYQPTDENKMVMVDLCDTILVNVVPVENPVRLVMMDTGITTSLTEQDLDNLRAVFTAVILGEGDTVAELFLQHARHSDCQDVAMFKKELGDIVSSARESTIKLGKIQVGMLLSQVFSVLMRHRVKLESNFVSIMIALFVLEGLGRSLDPDLDLLEIAKPVLLHRR